MKNRFGHVFLSEVCCLLLTALIAVRGEYVSLAHSVFLPTDQSANPFSDRFVQRVINMDRNQLHSIPQLDDNQMLLQLVQNDDTLGGKLVFMKFD